MYGPTPEELPTVLVERRDFLLTISSRGELKSAQLGASGQGSPDAGLADRGCWRKTANRSEQGRAWWCGSTSRAQEDLLIERQTEVRQVDSEIDQARGRARNRRTSATRCSIMQATYNVERAQLEASKQEILAEIEAEKAKIDVDHQPRASSRSSRQTAEASDMSQERGHRPPDGKRGHKADRDLALSRTYLEQHGPAGAGRRALSTSFRTIVPKDPSARPGLRSKRATPCGQGQSIAEIPDLESLRVEFRVDEVDRGRVAMEHQETLIRIDAVPDATLDGSVSWLSPIATLGVQ